jgi:hypothetical protein
MSKGGGSSKTTSTQKVEPWSGAQPYMLESMKRYQSVGNTPYEAYPGQRIADMTPEQRIGLGMTTQRAIAGSPVMNAAQNNLYGTLTGQYMSPATNPWLKQNVDTALGQAGGAINAQFNKPGAWGSSSHEGVMAREFGNIASNMYGQNYDNERTRQMQANMFAPQAAASDYADAQALTGVGDVYRSYEQDLLNQQLADWYEKKNYPQTMADWYGSRIAQMGGMGSASTTKGPNPYQANPMANAIGAGTAGYGIANSILGAGANAAGSAALGALPWGLGAALIGGLLS